MSEKFDKRCAPAVQHLRQALAAVERAKRDEYAPHVSACMIAAIDHADRAKALLERAAP